MFCTGQTLLFLNLFTSLMSSNLCLISIFKSLFQLFYLGSQNSEKFILRAFLNHFFLGSLKFLVLLFLLLSKFKLKLERKLVYFGSHKFMVLKCTRRSMGHCSKVILPLHFSCFFNNFWTQEQILVFHWTRSLLRYFQADDFLFV